MHGDDYNTAVEAYVLTKTRQTFGGPLLWVEVYAHRHDYIARLPLKEGRPVQLGNRTFDCPSLIPSRARFAYTDRDLDFWGYAELGIYNLQGGSRCREAIHDR